MDIQRELKNDLTSIKGVVELQDGIYLPLKEVERILLKRIEQAINFTGSSLELRDKEEKDIQKKKT